MTAPSTSPLVEPQRISVAVLCAAAAARVSPTHDPPAPNLFAGVSSTLE